MARTVTHSLVKALRAVPDFEGLDDDTLLAVVGESVNLFWPAGDPVFEPGQPAEALYVVLSGAVRIYEVTDGGAERDIITVTPGGFFGERSLLLEAKHSKWAVALADSELCIVPRESFQGLMSSQPDLAAQLVDRMERGYPPR